ncbi:hypothetical protein D3C85_1544740 [compost metagenome]
MLTRRENGLFIDSVHLSTGNIGGQQRIIAHQRRLRQFAIQRPRPAWIPAQGFLNALIAHRGSALQRLLDFINGGLLIGGNHFHQHAALRAFALQILQQPQLNGVMRNVGVLFAHNDLRSLTQNRE